MTHSLNGAQPPPLSTGGERYLTKTERATQALRDAILRGTITAGAQLTVGELAQQLGMSPTPVREAIRILQAEGLLTQTPHHTITAIAFTEHDIVDIFDLRAVLEALAVRLATPNLTEADFARLNAIHEQMRAAQLASDHPAVHQINAEWHITIYRASRNPFLVETIENLWRKFLWESLWTVPTHTDTSLEQHAAIMAAMRARRADAAADLMAQHMAHGKETGVRFFRQRQGKTEPDTNTPE
jgi:DNA-binding GntR family transcriptional regulator